MMADRMWEEKIAKRDFSGPSEFVQGERRYELRSEKPVTEETIQRINRGRGVLLAIGKLQYGPEPTHIVEFSWAMGKDRRIVQSEKHNVPRMPVVPFGGPLPK